MSELIELSFPRLKMTGYSVTSERTPIYNCIAWAANDQTEWWWPDADGDSYWPQQAPRAVTMEAFIAAYGILGYQPCADAIFEPEYEKIAIYVDAQGTPTHAARMTTTGSWTSKLGMLEDIEHNTLDGLYESIYGHVGQVLRRPRVR